jgi:hypothetical protein
MFTPPVTSGSDVVASVRSAPFTAGSPMVGRGVAIGVDKLAVTRLFPEGGAGPFHPGVAGSSTAVRNAAMASATASGARLGR